MKQNLNELIFLTVGNNRQKALFEKLLFDSALCRDLNIIVVSDSESGRIGSGGAVLNIISKYYSDETKLLIVNSGGFSKRCINYAIRGKALTNCSYKKKASALLEIIIDKALSLMKGFDCGALVCCGDILVDTDNIDIKFDNNIGFCAKSNCTVGSRHGVMFSDTSGKMTHFLHKAPIHILEAFCKNTHCSYVPVDTGMVFFNNDFCQKAKQIENQLHVTDFLKDENIDLNLYPDIVSILSSELSEQEYLSSSPEKALQLKKALYNALSSFSMKIIPLDSTRFFHFGTLQETIDNIFLLSDQTTGLISFNSIAGTSSVGNHTVLDNTVLEGNCTIGNNCLITDITLQNVIIPDNSSVCGIKLLDGSFVTIACDIDENPKNVFNGTALWDTPRFYKGISFSDSYNKFISQQQEGKISLSTCIENADYSYFSEHNQIISDTLSHFHHNGYAEYREKIIDEFFSDKAPCAKLSFKEEIVQIHIPVRINLSGTWSDAMPYCIENGGQVINMAVKINGCLPVKIVAEKRSDSNIVFISDNKSIVYDFTSPALFDDFSDFILHKAVLDVMGINHKTEISQGFTLTTEVKEIDKGSGLGTSSILLGGCIVALSKLLGVSPSRNEVIKMVFVAEQLMKTGGGWQDQIGGLTPGIKKTTTSAGIVQIPDIDIIEISDELRNFVKSKFVLIPTGQRHFGRFIVTDVVNRYLEKQDIVLCAYKDIIALNDDVQKSILTNNFSLLRQCINKHFELLRIISPKTTNSSIDSLVEACSPFIDGVCVCGAGGGGYLLAILRDDVELDKLQAFMTENFPSITSPVLNIDISFDRMLEI